MSLRHQLTLWIGLISLAVLGLVAWTTTLELRQGGQTERLEELRNTGRLYRIAVHSRLAGISNLASGISLGDGHDSEATRARVTQMFGTYPALERLSVAGEGNRWKAERVGRGCRFEELAAAPPDSGWSLEEEPLKLYFCSRVRTTVWVEVDLARVLEEEKPAIATPVLVDGRDWSVLNGPEGLGPTLNISGLVNEADYWVWLSPLLPGQLGIGLAWREEEMLSTIDLLLEKALLTGLLGNLILISLVWLVSATITNPLNRLTEQTGAIARGDLERLLPDASGQNEVARLTRSFHQMQKDLLDYLRNLQAAVRERERLQQEMKFGARIQRSFLPEAREGEEVALLDGALTVVPVFRSALEVAGDFLDYFPLGSDRLGLVVGDVSGKGLSAGLMMARTQVLVRAYAAVSESPAACLRAVNRLLCEEAREGMFVTALYMVIDRTDGSLSFANAGHLPPVLLTEESSFVELPEGLVLGVASETQYENARLSLLPGQTMLLYTDGATEAVGENEEFFGEDRLLKATRCCRTARDCVRALQQSLAEFSQGRQLRDDLTLLAIQLNDAAKPSQ